MDEQEEILQNNMISNLPLLFANGYPTSLDKITESQLEKFIPFMVQCSLGHINLQGQLDCSEPEWWPEDLPFNIPFSKPKKFNGNWIQKLKEVVLICYQFHKSVFLLRFCNDLSSYEHASLRFINNYNSTTSLFDRRSNKLLVTFRNENMSYDQPQRLRKCLLQQKSKSDLNALNTLQQMVEPAPFDIYLCDNCDAELYSKEAILEHEKTCVIEDDDVILCDSPELCNNVPIQKHYLEDNTQRIGFFLNFNLKYKYNEVNTEKDKCYDGVSKTYSIETLQKEAQFMIIDKKRRISRRSRAVHSVSRCPTIPLSSPAGQLLLRTTKTVITPEYLTERLDRIERFCHAPLVSKLTSRPKFLEKRNSICTPHCTFKRPQEYSSHLYIFPRRQFSQKRRMENILLINSTLLRRCRPISVRLKKISDTNKQYSSHNNNLNIKLTRDNSRSSNWKISSSPSTEIIVDTIDLCTSDEDDNEINFYVSNDLHIANTNATGSDITVSHNKDYSVNSLPINSTSQISKQVDFSMESSLFQYNLKTSYNKNCSTSSLTKADINYSDVCNEELLTNFTKPFKSSVHKLSNGSTIIPTKQNVNAYYDERCEKVDQLNTVEKNKIGATSENRQITQNIVNKMDNLVEKNSLRNLKTHDHGKQSVPLLLHKNRVISIDLTS
ncbi:ovaries absent [Cochliomyia hominivorax]